MVAFVEFAALTLSVFGFLCWLVNAIERKHPRLRNPVAFCLALGGAYSASFSLDIVAGATWGFYKFSPFTVPMFTWAGIAFSLYLLATWAATSQTVLRVPYLLLGAIAVFAGVLGQHRHSIFVGVPLLIAGFVVRPVNTTKDRIGLPDPNEATAQSSSNDPTYEELVQRLRELESEADEEAAEALSLGPYKLDSRIASYPEVIEFSQLEYEQAYTSASRERMFKAPPVIFLDTGWEVEITTVDGWIRGITARSVSDLPLAISCLHESAFRHYHNKFGAPAATDPDVTVWHTSNGQIDLCHDEGNAWSVIGLTSLARK